MKFVLKNCVLYANKKNLNKFFKTNKNVKLKKTLKNTTKMFIKLKISKNQYV